MYFGMQDWLRRGGLLNSTTKPNIVLGKVAILVGWKKLMFLCREVGFPYIFCTV